MSYQPADMGEAQAIGLCYAARQQGLPDIHSIRQAVAQLHATECGWCAYPPAELIRMLERWHSDHPTEPGTWWWAAPHAADKRWWAMPAKARLTAIGQAQVTE